MNKPPRDVYADNEATWRRLVRFFERREKQAIVWIGSNSHNVLLKQYWRFKEEFPAKFEHIEVRVDQMKDRSIYAHLTRLLAEKNIKTPSSTS